jgi:hypothetical protein
MTTSFQFSGALATELFQHGSRSERSFLACLSEAFQHAGEQSGVLEAENGREPVPGPASEPNAAKERLAGDQALGTRPFKTRGGLRWQNPSRPGR